MYINDKKRTNTPKDFTYFFCSSIINELDLDFFICIVEHLKNAQSKNIICFFDSVSFAISPRGSYSGKDMFLTKWDIMSGILGKDYLQCENLKTFFKKNFLSVESPVSMDNIILDPFRWFLLAVRMILPETATITPVIYSPFMDVAQKKEVMKFCKENDYATIEFCDIFINLSRTSKKFKNTALLESSLSQGKISINNYYKVLRESFSSKKSPLHNDRYFKCFLEVYSEQGLDFTSIHPLLPGKSSIPIQSDNTIYADRFFTLFGL